MDISGISEEHWETAQKNVGLVYTMYIQFCNERPNSRWIIEQHKSEFIQEGLMALGYSVSKFDPSRGFQLSTFARLPVRGKFIGYLAKLKRESDHLSIDEPGSDEDGTPLEERLDVGSPNPILKEIESSSLSSMLNKYIGRLPGNKKRIVEMLFFEGITMEEAGKIL